MGKLEYRNYICRMLEDIEDVALLKRIYCFVHRFFIRTDRKRG